MNSRVPRRRSLARRILSIFAVIILMESAFLLILLLMLESSEAQLKEERQVRAVLAATAKFSSTLQFCTRTLIKQTLISQINSPNPLINKALFKNMRMSDYASQPTELTEYKQIFEKLPQDLKGLKVLIKEDDSFGQERVKELETSTEESLDLTRKVLSSAEDRTSQPKKMLHYHFCVQLLDLSRSMIKQLAEIESRYRETEMDMAQSVAAHSGALFYVSLIAGFLVNAGVAVVLYLFVIKNITSRLHIVTENTFNLIVGKPLLEPVPGADDVAELDETFREMASALDESRTKEEAILEHTANFLCSLAPNGTIMSVPPSSSAMWGYNPEELRGRRISSIIETGSEQTLRAIESLVALGESASFENQIRCRDGSVIDLAWTANLNEDGNLVCVAHNITERNRINKLIRESERRFSRVVEQLPAAVVSCDRLFVIESVNPATAKMFLYPSNELLGKSLDVLLTSPVGRRSKASEELGALMEHALEQTTHLNVWRADRSQMPVELDLSAYAAPQGQRFLACFRDITARIELELAKRDFVSMISHDLRSPLMSLYGSLELIAAYNDTAGGAGGASDSENAHVFARSVSIVEKLVSLINDFLDLGQIEAGHYPMSSTGVVLSELLLEGIRLSDTNDGCPAVLRMGDSDPLVRLDRELVAQAVACLIETTIYFNPGEPFISVDASGSSEQAISISISGEHCRFPQDVKATCAEGYALIQMDDDIKATDRKSGRRSSALRLARSRAIVQAHGGTLCVTDSEGSQILELRLPMLGS